MQATTPMGFTWSVVLAHTCMQMGSRRAYQEPADVDPRLDNRIQFMRDEDAPFHIIPRIPLFLIMLDDEVVITSGWSDDMVMDLYAKIRNFLENAGISISKKKSSPPRHVD